MYWEGDMTTSRIQFIINPSTLPDLERAASGGCGHFVENLAFLAVDGGGRVEDGELRMDQ